jgi:hypothetical protein
MWYTRMFLLQAERCVFESDQYHVLCRIREPLLRTFGVDKSSRLMSQTQDVDSVSICQWSMRSNMLGSLAKGYELACLCKVRYFE